MEGRYVWASYLFVSLLIIQILIIIQYVAEAEVPETASGTIRGDMNLDGKVSSTIKDIYGRSDVDAFALGLMSDTRYELDYGVPVEYKGDTDDNGRLDFDDIGPFTRLLAPAAPTARKALFSNEFTDWIYNGDTDKSVVGRGYTVANGRYVVFEPVQWFFVKGTAQFTIVDSYTDTSFNITVPTK